MPDYFTSLHTLTTAYVSPAEKRRSFLLDDSGGKPIEAQLRSQRPRVVLSSKFRLSLDDLSV